MNLLKKKMNKYSQIGEDGILSEILDKIGSGGKFCVEFGAWDGLHFSNTRALVEQGWGGAFIEMDPVRYLDLVKNCKNFPGTYPIQAAVGTGEENLAAILGRSGVPVPQSVDLLSIDVDGLDYYIFSDLGLRARLIVVEVSAAHAARETSLLPKDVAKNNVGQPLTQFVELGRRLGYQLVCYNGNAFFVEIEEAKRAGLPDLSAQEAYSEFLEELKPDEKEWLWLINRGWVDPFHRYHNPDLETASLRLGFFGIIRALIRGRSFHFFVKRLLGRGPATN